MDEFIPHGGGAFTATRTAYVSHTSVMAEEALHWLAIRPDGIYVDATAGAGGHAALIAEQLTAGRLVALDRDPLAVVMATERLASFPQATVLRAEYGGMAEALASLGISRVDGVLIDAGCSSMQLDTESRGFSFQADGPLDMRMDPKRGESALELLRRLSEGELETVLRDYGDVGPAGRIAGHLKKRVLAGTLQTTLDLVEAVSEALPFVSGTPNEVRTVFQAIRIAVNDELNGLRRGIESAIECLAEDGRLVVISFHSGEDRVVKQVMREASRKKRVLYPDGRVRSVEPKRLKVLTSGPILASEAELRDNSRSKSAKLRAALRI